MKASKNKGTPQSSKSFDHFSIETYGNLGCLGIPPFLFQNS